MITRLENSLNKGMEAYHLGLVIKDLVHYTKFHFSSEERVMQQINYPEFENQKKMHETLIQNVINILLNLKDGKEITSKELISFLTKWLYDHIVNEDKKIGKYYKVYSNISVQEFSLTPKLEIPAEGTK
jgi:hemerythrin-like metal-binding protein